jgi:hypothetical protein
VSASKASGEELHWIKTIIVPLEHQSVFSGRRGHIMSVHFYSVRQIHGSKIGSLCGVLLFKRLAYQLVILTEASFSKRDSDM